MSIVVYPGTFDPLTNGHIDLVRRAMRIFDRVIVAVALSSRKKTLFTLDERLDMCRQCLNSFENVEVRPLTVLVADFLRESDAHAVMRGLRAVSDFEYEFQLANMNRALHKDFETIFLTPADHLSYISSTLVKEIAQLNGDVSSFVPPTVDEALRQKNKPGEAARG